MTVEEILTSSTFDVMKMNEKELRSAVRVLARAANARYDRLVKSEVYTPARRYIENHGGRFSTKDKNLNQLRKEFTRAQGFLNRKTSSVIGYKQMQKEFTEKFSDVVGKDISLNDEQWGKLWDVYHRLEELGFTNVVGFGSSQREAVISKVVQENPNLSTDDLVSKLNEKWRDLYEAETESESTGISTNNRFTVEEMGDFTI